MFWNKEKGYKEYNINLSALKEKLNIGIMDHEVRPELAPYLVPIIKHLNFILIDFDNTNNFSEKLKAIFDEFDRGADIIVKELDADKLAREIGIDTSIPTIESPGIIKYSKDRFIFCWSNVMSCLITRLKIQYAHLLVDPIVQGCKCTCGTGETTKDWEKYTSGVWPEDEKYSNLDYGTTSSWRLGNDKSECTCCHRR